MSDNQFSFPDGSGGRVFIDCFGVGKRFTIIAGGKPILFSWSDLFGPLPETKTGAVRDIGPKHPFWRAASLWNLQKRRIRDDGICVWHEPKKPVLKHVGGRNYLLTENGEEGYDW